MENNGQCSIANRKCQEFLKTLLRLTRLLRLDEFCDDPAVNFSQPLLAALMQVAERVLVESELIQNRCVDVAEVNRLLHGLQPDFIRRAVNLSAFYAASGHHHGEPEVVMV